VDYAFWNTLHDGCISAISGIFPGDITLTIEIEYLCAWLPTTSKAVQVLLHGCTEFTFTPYDGTPIDDLQKIASLETEVLSAKTAKGVIEVVCTGGTLTAVYGVAEVFLQEGLLVTQESLEAAADGYWSDWEARNRRR
jgi:hypothetical protein